MKGMLYREAIIGINQRGQFNGWFQSLIAMR
jgi:hypothetical protein